MNLIEWIIYVFGGFLILTGIKMIVKREEEIHSERNPVVKWFKRLMPVTPDYRGDNFFVRKNGIRMATPLYRPGRGIDIRGREDDRCAHGVED